MDEEAEKRVRVESLGNDVDRLSSLPDSLLCQILLNNPTRDVVRTSVLSKRWRNIWRYVPGLDLGYGDFPEYNAFVSFIDRFLKFNNESCLQKFELRDHCLELNQRWGELKFEWEWDEPDAAHVIRWIDIVVKRKIQHIHVLESTWDVDKEGKIPTSVYTCESLITLELCDVFLAQPESVCLPSVKVIDLQSVKFANDSAFKMLISGCPVLETLTVERCPSDNVKVLRVCSQSLLSFSHIGHYVEIEEELVVVIDAPKLKYLNLCDHDTDSFVLHNLVSLVKVNMGIVFHLSSGKMFDPNDLPKRNMIRKFFLGIASVKEMKISSDTLEAIYNYSKCERVPLLRNLSSLCASFSDYRWEMLPVFLESCPNLKSLSLDFSKFLWEESASILPGHHGILQTLESVKIVKTMTDEEAEMKMVTYFLENSASLKKLTLVIFPSRKNEASVILEKLLTIPRLSTSCQIVVL